jgi:hypothetical protein
MRRALAGLPERIQAFDHGLQSLEPLGAGGVIAEFGRAS